MNTNEKIGKVAGLLLLLNFINGIFIFQFLLGPILFLENFLTTTVAHSNRIVVSVVLGIFSVIAVLLIFLEELFSIFGQSTSMNMLLPIALIQLVLPLWLIYQGLNTVKVETIDKYYTQQTLSSLS